MKISGVIFAMMSSCKHTVEYDCTGITPTYIQNIKPVLDVACAREGCHSGSHAAGDLDLSTYASASAASKKKNFLGTIQHKPFYPKMPQDGDILPDIQIHTIFCWIESGNPE
ncbi:MAG: hypothetical protein Q8M08_06580 [Bacteroidales bacterium]|nr:hypothetical protein [Bacteroidales bacterium]